MSEKELCVATALTIEGSEAGKELLDGLTDIASQCEPEQAATVLMLHNKFVRGVTGVDAHHENFEEARRDPFGPSYKQW